MLAKISSNPIGISEFPFLAKNFNGLFGVLSEIPIPKSRSSTDFSLISTFSPSFKFETAPAITPNKIMTNNIRPKKSLT